MGIEDIIIAFIKLEQNIRENSFDWLIFFVQLSTGPTPTVRPSTKPPIGYE